jgi:ankyrin repeat protein
MDLWDAVEENNLQEVEKLLQDENLNVNFQNENYSNWTPLLWGCSLGYTKIVLLLLSHKDINVNLVSSSGFTPFLWACFNGKTEIVKILFEDDRVNVNLADKYGWTPLMCSCFWGYTQTVKELLMCGRIDLFAKSTKNYNPWGITYKSGSTALYVTRERKRIDVISILEEEIKKRKQSIIKFFFITLL